MITTFKVPYRDGELRIGWASWDNGEYKSRSIKYAYPDSSGKISRGSPELPFDILVDMLMLATDEKEVDVSASTLSRKGPADARKSSTTDLQEEKKTLTVALMRFQQMMTEMPWANWQPIYDELGARLEIVKREIAKRS